MPGGVGGVASRDAPLSRLTATLAAAAPSRAPSSAPHDAPTCATAVNPTGTDTPMDTSSTPPIYTSLTDATHEQETETLRINAEVYSRRQRLPERVSDATEA